MVEQLPFTLAEIDIGEIISAVIVLIIVFGGWIANIIKGLSGSDKKKQAAAVRQRQAEAAARRRAELERARQMQGASPQQQGAGMSMADRIRQARQDGGGQSQAIEQQRREAAAREARARALREQAEQEQRAQTARRQHALEQQRRRAEEQRQQRSRRTPPAPPTRRVSGLEDKHLRTLRTSDLGSGAREIVPGHDTPDAPESIVHRHVADAERQPTKRVKLAASPGGLDRQSLRSAIIMAELLGPPVSLRNPEDPRLF